MDAIPSTITQPYSGSASVESMKQRRLNSGDTHNKNYKKKPCQRLLHLMCLLQSIRISITQKSSCASYHSTIPTFYNPLCIMTNLHTCRSHISHVFVFFYNHHHVATFFYHSSTPTLILLHSLTKASLQPSAVLPRIPTTD